MSQVTKALINSLLLVAFFVLLQFIKPFFWQTAWRWYILAIGAVFIFAFSLCCQLLVAKSNSRKK